MTARWRGVGALAGKAVMARTAVKEMSCLGRNLLVGGVEGATDGGVSGGLGYLASGQPVTLTGLAKATIGGAALGGGAGIAKVTGVSKMGCFTADTPILMADDTLRPISEVRVGDRVSSFDPESGRIVAGTVEETFVHEDVPTLRVTTAVVGSDGIPEALGEFT